MSLLKKIGEWTLVTFPLWGSVGTVSLGSYMDTSIPVVAYQDSFRRRFTPFQNFVGPLPASKMERVVYHVDLDQDSTRVTQHDVCARTILYDSNRDDIVDQKTYSIGFSARGIITINQPVTASDQSLFTRVVAEAKNQ